MPGNNSGLSQTRAIEPRYRPGRLRSEGFWVGDYGGGVRVALLAHADFAL
jgi:hypothetical protein